MTAAKPTDQINATSGRGGKSLAALVRELDSRSRHGEDVTLGDALDEAGTRIHGCAILLLSLPESIPVPLPSFGAILGVPLLITSVHLAVYGEHGQLPDRARQIRLPQRMIAMMERYLSGPLARAERMSHDRIPFLARRERLVGAVCIFMSLLLMMPVPLMNVPPAVVLVCLSWGLLQKDGVFVGLGLAMAAGVALAGIAFLDLVAEGFDRFMH